MSRFRIGILGGGVVGLSTALCLLRNHRDLDITIVTDRDAIETTSYGPPGLFRPSVDGSNEFIREMTRLSYEHFSLLSRSEDAPLAGVQAVSGFVLGDNLPWLQKQEKDYGGIVTSFRWMKESEMDIFNQPHKHGFFYTTTMAEGQLYVPWLVEQVTKNGCKLVRRLLINFRELANDFDLLINCSGLGSRLLVPDDNVRPVRGVTIQVKAPWIKHFYISDEALTYIMPGINTVFLGTVRTMNDWNAKVGNEDRKSILNRCSAAMPSLKDVPIVSEWAGLRPYLPVPRVAPDTVTKSDGSKMTLIHNYGHGGNGVTLSWGSACVVDRLFIEQRRQNSKL